MNIENKFIGVNSESIASCESKEQLIKWKNELIEHLTTVKFQLEMNTARFKQGLPALKHQQGDWYVRAGKYKRLQAALVQQVNSRLSALKSKKKATNISTSAMADLMERRFWKDKYKGIASEEQIDAAFLELDELRSELGVGKK